MFNPEFLTSESDSVSGNGLILYLQEQSPDVLQRVARSAGPEIQEIIRHNVQGLLGMLPGVGKIKGQLDAAGLDDKILTRQEAIIQSMTKTERTDPDSINGSRRKRIAAGAGVEVSEVNKLLKMHRQMADMMKKMGKGGRMPMMPGMGGGGSPGGLPPGMFPGRR